MLNTLMTLKLDSELVQMYIRLYLSKIKDDFMLDYNISKYSDIQNQINYLKLVDAINITAKNGVDVTDRIAVRK